MASCYAPSPHFLVKLLSSEVGKMKVRDLKTWFVYWPFPCVDAKLSTLRGNTHLFSQQLNDIFWFVCWVLRIESRSLCMLIMLISSTTKLHL
jgi:hypothetical protein